MYASLKMAIATGLAATSLAIAKPADAMSFNFAYTFESDNLLSGVLEGKVVDEDTVVITEINKILFNEEEVDLVEVSSYFPSSGTGRAFESFGEIPFTALVTFSGDQMDVFACDVEIDPTDMNFGEGCTVGFAAFVLDKKGFIQSNLDLGLNEDFDSERWELEAITDVVPTPTAVLPVLAGMFGVTSKREKKSL